MIVISFIRTILDPMPWNITYSTDVITWRGCHLKAYVFRKTCQFELVLRMDSFYWIIGGSVVYILCTLYLVYQIRQQNMSNARNTLNTGDNTQNNYNYNSVESDRNQSISMQRVPSGFPSNDDNINDDNMDTATELLSADIQDVKQREMVLKAMREMRE